MQLFSRTSLVAFGTAAALAASSLTAPAFAEDTTGDQTAPIVAPGDIQDDIEDLLDTDKPVITEIKPVTTKVGNSVSVAVSADEKATFSAIGLPAGLSINPATGLISGTPTTAGVYTASVRAIDDSGNIGTLSIDFNVSEKEEEPSGSSDTDNISNWIKIITTVIGALTTILTFASNLDRFMGR